VLTASSVGKSSPLRPFQSEFLLPARRTRQPARPRLFSSANATDLRLPAPLLRAIPSGVTSMACSCPSPNCPRRKTSSSSSRIPVAKLLLTCALVSCAFVTSTGNSYPFSLPFLRYLQNLAPRARAPRANSSSECRTLATPDTLAVRAITRSSRLQHIFWNALALPLFPLSLSGSLKTCSVYVTFEERRRTPSRCLRNAVRIPRARPTLAR